MQWNNPIIEEVRKNRKELEGELDNIFKSLEEFQETIKDRLVTKEELDKRSLEAGKVVQ